MHIPKGGTLSAFTSVTTPAGEAAETCAPEAAKVDGAHPNSTGAPVQTRLGIFRPPAWRPYSLRVTGPRPPPTGDGMHPTAKEDRLVNAALLHGPSEAPAERSRALLSDVTPHALDAERTPGEHAPRDRSEERR